MEKYLIAVFSTDYLKKPVDRAVLFKLDKVETRYNNNINNNHSTKIGVIKNSIDYYPNKSSVRYAYKLIAGNFKPHLTKSGKHIIEVGVDDVLLKFNSDEEAELYFKLNVNSILAEANRL